MGIFYEANQMKAVEGHLRPVAGALMLLMSIKGAVQKLYHAPVGGGLRMPFFIWRMGGGL